MRLMALAALPLVLAVPTASAATWNPATSVAPDAPAGAGIDSPTPGILGRAVQMTRDARGDVAVAWTREDAPFASGPKHVQLAVKLVGRPWTQPEEVAPIGTVLQAIAMDGQGDVTLGYASSAPGSVALPLVRTRSSLGAWGAPHPIGAASDVESPAAIGWIGADAAGDLLVLYGDSSATGPQSTFKPAGKPWQAPVVLEAQPPSQPTGMEFFGMSANGTATAIMEQNAQPPVNLYTRRFTPRGGWQPDVPLLTIATADPLASNGALSVAGDGAATFALLLPDGTLVSSSRAAAAAAWTPLVTLGAPEIACSPIALAVDVEGEAVAACTRENLEGTIGGNSSTFAAVRAADGTWGPLADVDDQHSGGPALALAMADGGRALMVLPTAPPAGVSYDQGSMALERLPGQPWQRTALPAFDDSQGPLFPALLGGSGQGILALRTFSDDQGSQVTTGLQADLLRVPATTLTLRLAGRRVCDAPGRPCRSGRTAHVSVLLATGQRSLKLTIGRLHAGRWRRVRTVLVRTDGTSARATLRLPLGRIRISAATLHDTRAHPWVAYLLVR